MNLLGFENSTSYIDAEHLNNTHITLSNDDQVYKDIKRAREHAEYLAGENAKKDGYLGGGEKL